MNPFNAPLPGTTLRNITEEWKVLSGFHALMRQRMKLEAEHLRQLRQFQDSIDSTWSKSGVWPLISPIVDLWSSQMNIMEESSSVLSGIVEACPTKPSPDKPEEGIIPYSRYDRLHSTYNTYQDCQTAACSREAITEMQEWFKRNSWITQEAFPAIDRNYRQSVVVQRDTLRSVVEWHSTSLPEKLEAHAGHTEETQTCLRGYLAEFSKFASDFIRSISTAQKGLAEFSSLTFIDPSQRCFEEESLHPKLQPAVYLSHYLGGGAPANPVLGVLSYLPKLLEVGRGGRSSRTLSLRNFLEAEKENTSFEEMTERLKVDFSFNQSTLPSLALRAIGTLLPLSDDAFQRYKNGIQRNEITQLLKPFPIENCQMAAKVLKKSTEHDDFHPLSRQIFGVNTPKRLLQDIWRKWDFENHRPLPREVVRTLPEWNDDTNRLEGGELIIKKTGLRYHPLK